MRVSARVTPGAARTTVGGRYGESEPPVLLVRVQERAVDGRANEAVVGAVATAFGVSKSAVLIVHGHGSRTKVVDVDGGDVATLGRLLRGG